MRILGRLSLGTTALAALLGTVVRPADAHEKWFVGEPTGELRWDLLFRPLPLTVVGAGLFAGARGIWGHRRAPQPTLWAGPPNPRHPRRRAPARQRGPGDALLP